MFRSQSWEKSWCAVWLGALWLTSSVAQAMPQESVAVRAETINGQTLTLELLGIDDQGGLQVSGTDSRVNLAELLSLETTVLPGTDDSLQPRVLLMGGGEVKFQEVVLQAESLALPNSLLSSPIPLETVRGIIWKTDSAVDQALANPLSDKDQVVVANEGQMVTLEGILEGITPEKIQLNFEGKSRSIQREKILAIVFADLKGKGAAPGIALTATFRDGSRINGSLVRWQDHQLTLGVGTANLKMADHQLVRLDIQSDRLRFVADLESLAVETKPILAPNRGWKRNLSVEGNPLTLRMESGEPQVFRKGLGVAAYSRVAFQNSGAFTRLQGWVGIDTETDQRGNCRVLVRGDGIVLWEQALLGKRPAQLLDIDITGIEQLELIVEPGDQFDLADHVDWGNLRLTKQE